MKYLHILSIENMETKFHHTVDVLFPSKNDSMAAAVNVLDKLHKVLDIPLSLVTLENGEVIIKEEPTEGLLILSVDLPFGCFVEGASMDTDDLYMYDPESTPKIKKAIVC